jgi:uncharacterized protein (TIGR00369 family)
VSGAEIWQEEPVGGFADRSVLGMAALDRNRLAMEGRLPVPPMNYLTEISFDQASAGTAGFSMPASPWFANSAGLIPGGMLAPIADGALGASVGTELGPGVTFTTAELSLTFVRPARPGADAGIVASGQALHVGRSVGISEAFMLAEPGGHLLAHGTTRCAIFPPLDPLPEPAAEWPRLEQPRPGSDPSHPLRREPRGEGLGQEVFASRSGLEIVRAGIAGELPAPPLQRLTGLRATLAEEGRVEWVLPCSGWLSSPARSVQGGFIALLAEAALTGAVFTTTPPGTAIATLDLKVNYLRPVLPDGEDLLASARVLHRGRRLAVAGAELLKEGRRVALATGSAMYLPDRPASLSGVELPAEQEDA